tara:strand:- start:48 stop:521 length:474 start_codon:yes stop_codon:yes gene_type:complete
MTKFQLTGFLKASKERIIVLLQFFIIILHFIKFEFLPKIKITYFNSTFSFMGFLTIIIASIVMLKAIKDLGGNLSPFPRPLANCNLTTSGIYRIMRHPMYYSLILISFGVFLIKLSLYYLFLTISLALVIKSKINLEEKYLNNKFKNYWLYKDKVKY